MVYGVLCVMLASVIKNNPEDLNMTASLHQTKVDMSGLLEVLGKNLYSTPTVAIRELIQNAHDACVRRQIETKNSSVAFSQSDAAIYLSVNHAKNRLILEDNGSGLTKEEITQFLATIGSGYTRVLRNQTQTEQMVGYFGLGFLSAYVVADQVDVWTTSYQTPTQTWHFRSNGGERYVIEAADAAQYTEVGTKVQLRLKSEFSELSSIHVLTSLINKYCALLPIAIINKTTQQRLNATEPPWLLPADTSPIQKKRKALDFAQVFEPDYSPICTIELAENSLGAEGILWIQDASDFATNDHRHVSVFVRNMFISSDVRGLLPNWAGFVGCVVNCAKLTPTASREDIQTDAVFDELLEILVETLINGLIHIQKHQPENWRRITLRHNQNLIGASVSDYRLFDALKDTLKIPTSLGNISLPDILKRSDNQLYIRTESTQNYEDTLFRARMIPVVLGYYFAVTSFCQFYLPESQLVFIGSDDNKQLFNPVAVSDAVQTQLNWLFLKDKEEIIACEFTPEFIPLVVVEDQSVKIKKRIEDDETDKQIGMAALRLARIHTSTIDDTVERRLFINMNNNLIDMLLDNTLESSKTTATAQLIRSYMMSLCATDNEDTNQTEQFMLALNSLLT